jgi:hypothetical protein
MMDGVMFRTLNKVTNPTGSAQIAVIRALRKPSAIAVVCASKSLRTARGLMAPATGRKHTFRETLVSGKVRADISEFDVVFCDSIAFFQLGVNKRFVINRWLTAALNI